MIPYTPEELEILTRTLKDAGLRDMLLESHDIKTINEDLSKRILGSTDSTGEDDWVKYIRSLQILLNVPLDIVPKFINSPLLSSQIVIKWRLKIGR